MQSFVVVLILALSSGIATAEVPYVKVDSESVFKNLLIPLVKVASDYIVNESPEFPDISESKDSYQHLELLDNKFTDVNVILETKDIGELTVDAAASTITVELTNPLNYEVDGNFLFEYLAISLEGTYALKESSSMMKLVFKIDSSGRSPRMSIDKVDITLGEPEITVKGEEELMKNYKVKEFIGAVLRKNLELHTTKINEALKAVEVEFFEKIYKSKDDWQFNLYRADHQMRTQANLTKFEVRADKKIALTYDLDLDKATSYSEEPNLVRRISIGTKLVKDLIKITYFYAGITINDDDLPKEMQNRLDIITFQKFLPDFAIKSIKNSGLKNNFINVTLTVIKEPVSVVNKTKNTLEVTAEYDIKVKNKDEILMEGAAEVKLDLNVTWFKSYEIGFINFEVQDASINIQKLKAVNYPLLEVPFNSFLGEIKGKLESDLKKTKLINEGIPLSTEFVEYNTSKQYWEEEAFVIELIN